MFNLKSAFAIAVLSTLSVSANADEMMIDTSDLHASITAELTQNMEKMHQDLSEDTNTLLIAKQSAGINTAQAPKSE